MSDYSVSVVVPAYNASGTLGDALDSVIEQTFLRCPLGIRGRNNVEIIVVDDASTDGLEQVCSGWCTSRGLRETSGEQSAREWTLGAENESVAVSIRLCRLQSNGGPGAARNHGIREASGEWIAFLDADDIWTSRRLEAQAQYLSRNPEVLFLSGEAKVFSSRSGRPRGGDVESLPSLSADVLSLQEFACRNPLATSTVLVSKPLVIEAGGFNEAYRGPEDYDLWMRLQSCSPCHKLQVHLAWHRSVPGSLSQDDLAFHPQVLGLLNKAFSPAGPLGGLARYRRAALANQYVNLSWMAFASGARGRALRYWFIAFCYSLMAAKQKKYRLTRMLVRYGCGKPEHKQSREK